jgi:hypothetical protein
LVTFPPNEFTGMTIIRVLHECYSTGGMLVVMHSHD